jgi:hypothetical protein
MDSATVDLLTLGFAAISSIATCGWVIRNWKLRREDMPRIEMDCRIEKIFVGNLKTIIKVCADVKNSGAVRHKFKHIKYDLRGLDGKTINHNSAKLLNQVDFDISLRNDQMFFPKSWEYSFVDAGTTSTYTSVIAIPNNVKVLHLNTKMLYSERESDFHQAIWVGVL